MGVGGDNSWGMRPHPEFTMYSDSVYTYRFRLLPILPSQSAMSLSKRSFRPLKWQSYQMSFRCFTPRGFHHCREWVGGRQHDQTFSTSIPFDHVITQSPSAGSLVALGTPVRLTISLGVVQDVALGKPASASTEETSKGNTANKGNDGDTETRWCASDGSLNQWWMVISGRFILFRELR